MCDDLSKVAGCRSGNFSADSVSTLRLREVAAPLNLAPIHHNWAIMASAEAAYVFATSEST